MLIRRKRVLISMLLCTLLAAGGYGAKTYIENNRAIAVFNDTEEKYFGLLEEGLPDEHDNAGWLSQVINKALGFDASEKSTIIESSSALFEEAEKNISEEPEETAVPEKKDEPALPTFAQICSSTGIAVNNATSYSVNPDVVCAEPLNIPIDTNGAQVLIVHTHTTECYDGDNQVGTADRTTDETKNVTAIGAIIKEVLEKYGIACIHDTTVHDYPTYQGAYTRELSTIEKCLNENPSIKLVLDVHRDAFIYSDGSKLKLDCEVNGESTAKVMIVCGTDAMGLSHPEWRENFKLASKIQNAAQIMYPGMMRPLNLRRERFNMHTTTGSLILEVGANGNSLDQAQKAGENIAAAIAAVLINRE